MYREGRSRNRIRAQTDIERPDRPCSVRYRWRRNYHIRPDRNDDIIRINDTSLGVVTYYQNLSDAQNEVSPITNPTEPIQNTSTNQLVARVENSFGCAAFAIVKSSDFNQQHSKRTDILYLRRRF